MSRVSDVYVGKRSSWTKIGLRQTVVPGEGIFVPHGPQKTHEKSARRKHIAHAAPKHLPRRGRFTGKAGDLQASQHHAWSSPAENREERKILQVHDNERRDAHSGAQFAECKLATKRTKESEKGAIRKEQAAGVYQAGNAALIDRGDWVQAGLLGARIARG